MANDLGEGEARALPPRVHLNGREQLHQRVRNVGGARRGQAHGEAAEALGSGPAHDSVAVAQAAQQRVHHVRHDGGAVGREREDLVVRCGGGRRGGEGARGARLRGGHTDGGGVEDRECGALRELDAELARERVAGDGVRGEERGDAAPERRRQWQHERAAPRLEERRQRRQRASQAKHPAPRAADRERLCTLHR